MVKLIKKFQEYLFKRRMARLTKKRLAAPPPPITKLEELLCFSETIARDIERFNYRFFDGINEGIIPTDDPLFKIVMQLKFSSERLKDEFLIKVQNQ